MAEGGGYRQVHLREAEKPVCDMCKAQSDIQLSKCLDCNIVEREPNMILNTSKMCKSHRNEVVMYHCSTCNDLICSECVIETHKKHEFTKIKAFAQKKRKSLKVHINTANNEMIPTMTQGIDKLKEQRNINHKHKEDNLRKLQIQIKKITSELEKVGKEYEAEYIKHYQKDEDKMEAIETKLTKDISEIQTMIRDFDTIYQTGSDIEVIRAEKVMAEKLKLPQADNPTNMDTQEDLPIFIEGKIDNKIIKTMFGYLQSSTNKFTYKSEPVQSICPLTDNTAFIRYGGLPYIDRVTVDGKLQQTIKLDFKVIDFILTCQGDVMATPADSDPKIYRLTKEGVITDTISTGKLLPHGLCETKDGHVLVSLVDGLSYNINKSSRRIVSKITLKGKFLQTYEYNNGSRIFTVPCGVSENINGDMCIVNRTSVTTGHLIILDNSGQLKLTYNGQQLDKEFLPIYVKCDTVGNVLVNDYYNQKVHMLNSQYQFVRFVITENMLSDRPSSLAVDNKTGGRERGSHGRLQCQIFAIENCKELEIFEKYHFIDQFYISSTQNRLPVMFDSGCFKKPLCHSYFSMDTICGNQMSFIKPTIYQLYLDLWFGPGPTTNYFGYLYLDLVQWLTTLVRLHCNIFLVLPAEFYQTSDLQNYNYCPTHVTYFWQLHFVHLINPRDICYLYKPQEYFVTYIQIDLNTKGTCEKLNRYRLRSGSINTPGTPFCQPYQKHCSRY
ncbi:hypothetical protein KUTeg_018719 [Tegillarca granosa]|uniref:B box-type domain-containing protein n=1 Tax=Tegillarca granosa TaxID=220873 RepID=A0ABQ9EHA9_TEGGR|nr:hypothetical protein KUTeg_018719 [Tegillarca granosa]